MSGSTWVSRYQKGKTKKVKTNLDLLEQEIVSGSGICWAICKSAPLADNHANIPPLSFFTGRMPFLTPNQQRQSTEGSSYTTKKISRFSYSRLGIALLARHHTGSKQLQQSDFNFSFTILQFRLFQVLQESCHPALKRCMHACLTTVNE